MDKLFKKYLVLLKNRDFLLLNLIIFIGQVASAFLILALIASVFAQTGSSLAVSGIILSFAVPSFLLMAFAGLTADIFDRKTIIVWANFAISAVVLLILISGQVVYASIPLAFFYFAANSFFIPASSAATAQLVKKRELLTANSIFIFALAGGVIMGLFIAAIISFFKGPFAVLFVCEVLLVIAAVLSLFLPKLPPRKRQNLTILKTIADIKEGFAYILTHREAWFFFVMFAVVQGVIAFGITLAPGFFDRVIGIPIEKSPILIFPLIGLGVILGTLLAHLSRFKEGFLTSFGLGILGVGSLLLGIIIRFSHLGRILILAPVSLYLVAIGLGAVVGLTASRTALQKSVAHNYQGTVFGANIILASLFSGILSPAAATFEALWGYSNILTWGGAVISISGVVSYYVAYKWKF